MFIQTEQTPNPATLKFLPGKTVMDDGVAEFTEPAEAERLSPLAAGCSRSRASPASTWAATSSASPRPPARTGTCSSLPCSARSWSTTCPATQPPSRGPRLVGGGKSAEDDPTVRQIKELIETRVRPAVAQDGGDIVFHGFERGVVYLHLRGACSGCPSSIVTLKNGIENLLKYYVPEVVEVRAIS